MFKSVFGESMIKRAKQNKVIDIKVHNLRDWTHDRHRTADDRPFGGGPGMVMKAGPIYGAVEELTGKRKTKTTRIIMLTPQGRKFDQGAAKKLSKYKRLILICGHYEGVDERARKIADEEISVGDYILTCGELPAMVLVDAVARLIPGFLGHEDSKVSESFEKGLLEYPQYTRPAVFKRMKVPKILLSGNHKAINEWRENEAIRRTKKRRPDLIKKRRKK